MTLKAVDIFPGGGGRKENSITIALRSFVLPPDSKDDFPIGKPLPPRVSPGTPGEKLMDKILAEKADQIGMVVINGKVAEGKVLLADGDRVIVYEPQLQILLRFPNHMNSRGFEILRGD